LFKDLCQGNSRQSHYLSVDIKQTMQNDA